MAIIGDLVPPRERGRYQGIMAGVMAVAMVAGPLVGGYITDNLDWRWAFYVNLPLGAIALFFIGPGCTCRSCRTKHRIDWAGAGRARRRHHRARADHHVGRQPVRVGLRSHLLGLVVIAVVALVAFVVRRAAAPPSRCCRWACSATATSRWSR